MSTSSLILSPAIIGDAVAEIRRRVPRASRDKFPEDFAAPTALYLGVALTTVFPMLPPSDLASSCGVNAPDALEFSGLVDLAARSTWIDPGALHAACAIIAGASVEPATNFLRCDDPSEARPPAPRVPKTARERAFERDRRAASEQPQFGPVPLSEITRLHRLHCRWPIGDPANPDFHFCGQRVDGAGVYCAEHRFRSIARRPEAAP